MPSKQQVAAQAQDQNQLANSSVDNLNPVERAARTINEMLNHDLRYPDLDSYVGREF
jgi:hypothetical protein